MVRFKNIKRNEDKVYKTFEVPWEQMLFTGEKQQVAGNAKPKLAENQDFRGPRNSWLDMTSVTVGQLCNKFKKLR